MITTDSLSLLQVLKRQKPNKTQLFPIFYTCAITFLDTKTLFLLGAQAYWNTWQ